MDSFDQTAAMRSQLAKYQMKLKEDRIKMEQLTKMIEEYNELEMTLDKIVNKRKHSIMVPIGKKAFIPGYLTNTNDITVALGENYFITCSAQHAKEIAGRRKSAVKQNLSTFETQFDQLKEQLGLTTKLMPEQNTEGVNIKIKKETEKDPDLIIPGASAPTNAGKIQVIGETRQLAEGFFEIHEEVGDSSSDEEKSPVKSTKKIQPSPFDDETDSIFAHFAEMERTGKALQESSNTPSSAPPSAPPSAPSPAPSPAPEKPEPLLEFPAQSNVSLFSPQIKEHSETTSPTPSASPVQFNPLAHIQGSPVQDPNKKVSRFKQQRMDSRAGK